MSEEENRVKYVHLMVNNKFAKPFVDFLNKDFDVAEHVVLCRRCFSFPFPEGENVAEVQGYFYEHIAFNNPQIEKVICHSIYEPELVDFLYENKDLLKEKFYWQIWGGDLYDAPRDEKNDYVRRNFKAYITAQDKEYAINKYAMQGEFFDAVYVSPIDMTMIREAKASVNPHSAIHIQINNSADKTTLEMLDILAKFKDRDIIVFTVLSYGQLEYNEEILAKGQEIFKEKFLALGRYMPPELYAKHLANIDILILNQNRQQGGANVSHCLVLGKKVFIKKDNSRSIKLKSEGIKIYDTEDIEKMDFDDFIENLTAETNLDAMHKRAKKSSRTLKWKAIFDAK